MHRTILPLLALFATQLNAQTTYDHTIATQFQGVNSYVTFSFPATPATTGAGTLSLQWAACYSGGFGPSSITLQILTTPGWVTVLDEADNTSSCTFVNESVTIPAGMLADAIAIGGGSVQGRVDVDDGCQPGVGCSFLNDPVVQQLRLRYVVGWADFSNSDASICPGETVTFNDASLNTPTAFLWEFEGGQPATSTLQDPVVQYAVPGSYDVTLIIQTPDGPDTLEVAEAVVVHALPLVNAGADENICAGASVQLNAAGGTTYQWIPATGLSDANVPNPLAQPASNITYTVLVTDANGCQGSDALSISVHPAPVINVNGAAGDLLCSGDTLDLLAEGAALYTWQPNFFLSTNSGAAVQAWPPDDFSWNVTGTDEFGCVSVLSVFVDVVPAAATPNITVDAGVLLSTPAEGYQWFVDGDPIMGATEGSHAPEVNGDYSVMITDANGCRAESLPVYYGSVGINAVGARHLRVFPQPATDRLVIDGVHAGEHVQLMDATGRVVRSQRVLADGQVVLSVASLSGGNYMVEVRGAAASQRLPIVVR